MPVSVRRAVHFAATLCLYTAAAAVDAETIHAHFDCDGGKSIEAAFDNGAKPGVRLSLSDGRRWVLPQARSASGARYANAEESIVFWNKGDTAFIEEVGQTTYRDCVAKR
jgi:membrane-bound inhibitor of C-type lysozyme